MPKNCAGREIVCYQRVEICDAVYQAIEEIRSPHDGQIDSRPDKNFFAIALAEAIYALADYKERHGCTPGSMRFEISMDSERRGYAREKELDAINSVLTSANQESQPPS